MVVIVSTIDGFYTATTKNNKTIFKFFTVFLKRFLAKKPVFSVALDIVPEQPVDPTLEMRRVGLGLGRSRPDLWGLVQRLDSNSGKRRSHLDAKLGGKTTRFAAELSRFRRPARKPVFKKYISLICWIKYPKGIFLNQMFR